MSTKTLTTIGVAAAMLMAGPAIASAQTASVSDQSTGSLTAGSLQSAPSTGDPTGGATAAPAGAAGGSLTQMDTATGGLIVSTIESSLTSAVQGALDTAFGPQITGSSGGNPIATSFVTGAVNGSVAPPVDYLVTAISSNS